jgi:hypothetical protein
VPSLRLSAHLDKEAMSCRYRPSLTRPAWCAESSLACTKRQQRCSGLPMFTRGNAQVSRVRREGRGWAPTLLSEFVRKGLGRGGVVIIAMVTSLNLVGACGSSQTSTRPLSSRLLAAMRFRLTG